jgi:hypothetical protein
VVDSFGEGVESRTEADVAAQATAVLRRMFHSAPSSATGDGDRSDCTSTSGSGSGPTLTHSKTVVPDAIGCCMSAWRGDPFARGSWSTMPPSAPLVGAANSSSTASASVSAPATDAAVISANVRAAMAVDLGPGRVFFAGEHTHPDYSGTVHGAYWTGVREAQRIAASLA